MNSVPVRAVVPRRIGLRACSLVVATALVAAPAGRGGGAEAGVTMIAHGGTAGAIVEIAELVALAGLVAAVLLKQRRFPDDEPANDLEGRR